MKGVQFLIKCKECSANSSLKGTFLKRNGSSVTYETKSFINFGIRGALLGRSSTNPPSARRTSLSVIGSNYKFTTDNNGTITISGLTPGKYQVIEIYNPNQGYAIYPVQEKDIEVNSSATATVTMKNSKVPDDKGNLKILKVGKSGEEEEPLAGVQIEIRCTTSYSETIILDGYYVVYNNTTSKYEYVDYTTYKSIGSGSSKYTLPTTDSNGEIYIPNLYTGKYALKEVFSPHSSKYDASWSKSGVVVTKGTTVSIKAVNERTANNIGKMRIIKKDVLNGKTLSGATFTIQYKKSGEEYNGYYLTVSDGKAVYNKSKTTINTNSSGEIYIEDLYAGEYIITETKAPEGYSTRYTDLYSGKLTIEEGEEGAVELTVNNIPVTTLEITKEGLATKNKLKGATFTIQCKSLEYSGLEGYENKYLSVVGGNVIYTSVPYTFTTDSEGKISIPNVYTGTYIITETGNPNEGYWTDNLPRAEKVTMKAKDTQSNSNKFVYTAKNIETGTLTINKKDEDTLISLSGFKFTVKLVDKLSGYDGYVEEYIGKYVSIQSGKIVYTTEDKATQFESDSNGIIKIEGIIPGKYEITEVGQSTDKNGYDGKDRNNKVITATTEVKADLIEKKEEDIKNALKELDITGFVWEDIMQEKKDGVFYNNLYKQNNEADINLEGIKVRLMSTKSGKVAETTTKINSKTGRAEYKFTKVKVEDLPYLYVEFEYDGVTYTNVTKLASEDKKVTSKAEESEANRKKLNERFATIEDNGIIDDNIGVAKSNNGSVTSEIEYTRGEYESIVKSISNSGIVATTSKEYLYEYYKEYCENIKNGKTDDSCYWDEETKNFTIAYINLGLVRREQPDIAIKSVDLESVRTNVNGCEYTYRYADRKSYFTEDTVDYNTEYAQVGAKFNNDYYSQTYTKKYYTTDLKAATEGITFQTYMKYSIEIVNQSVNLHMKANNIVDYFDTNYKICTITCEGETIEDEEIGFKNEVYLVSGTALDNNTEYNAYKIDLSKYTIAPGEKITVTIEFELGEEAVRKLYDSRINGDNIVLNNIAEISSYSTYSDKDATTHYAGIDSDSAPENATPGNRNTYEDDTDYAAALKLELGNERKISGIVFEDNPQDINKEEVNNGYKRLGNGKYDSEEEHVQNVTVELINKKDNTPAKLYSSETNDNENITKQDGSYTITGVIPGEYYLQFTYTDENGKEMKINGEMQDVDKWKSTIITVSETLKKAMSSGDGTWYLEDEIKNGTYSIAVDKNPISNEEITMNLSTEDKISTKNSTSPNIKVGVEYTTDKASDYIDEKNGKLISDYNKMYFGIIEKPKTDIQLTKEISNIDITLQNGQKLISGNPATSLKYVRDVDNSSSEYGSSDVQSEMDSTLIFSSTLNITYSIKATNCSEIDYNTKDYYYYGTEGSAKVTTTVTKVIDYLDSKFRANDEIVTITTQDGNIITMKVDKNGYVVEISKIVDKDGNQLNYELLNINDDSLKLLTTEDARKSVKDGDNLLYCMLLFDNLNKALEIGETSLLEKYTVSRLLSNSDDDLKYENDAEILEIANVTGTPQSKSVPGNYQPGKSVQEAPGNAEKDSGKAIISVVPSTGEDKSSPIQYIIFTSIGLIVLAGGIFIIKKKVL